MHAQHPILFTAAVIALTLPARPDPTPTPENFEYDRQLSAVIARAVNREIVWTSTLDENVSDVRPPYLLNDQQRIYLSCGRGVRALDRASGKVLWRSPGAHDRLLLSGNLLLAADCRIDPKPKRLLLARSVTDGSVIFQYELPDESFNPLPIKEVAGLFLIQSAARVSGDAKAFLLTRDGKLWSEFNHEIVDVQPFEKDRLALTSHEVLCLSESGAVRWTNSFRSWKWIRGGGLVELPDQTRIAFLYGRISDSGVSLIRFDPNNGKIIWETRCAPLGAKHSGYNHQADVTIQGDQVLVTSTGDCGTFREKLDLRSGQQLDRQVDKN